MLIRSLSAFFPLLLVAAPLAWSAKSDHLLILTTAGKLIEGTAALPPLTVTTSSGAPRKLAPAAILSIHNGAPASPSEIERIQAGLAAIQTYKNEPIASPQRKASDAAVEELTAIGLPVMTPLLNTLKDTDQHEPRPLYRLFERLIPSEADQLDREASLIRLASGELLRGKIEPISISIDGQSIAWTGIRRLAVRRKLVTRDVEVHSLKHSTQIEYLDAGIHLSTASRLSSRAKGFVRLSWQTDGWASDANGLKVPGPNYKTNLVDGHPFGALVARSGAAGEVVFLGIDAAAKTFASGRLQLAINDNRHWQNNVGHFRVTLQATDAYDLGVAQ